jgi:hypothetical protein
MTAKVKKSNVILVTGGVDLQDCKTSRIPYFLDNWPTGDGEVISLTLQLHFTRTEFLVLFPLKG